MDKFDIFIWIVGAIFILLLILMGVQYDRLMKQCLADGKKEYECRALLNSKAAYMPIIITK